MATLSDSDRTAILTLSASSSAGSPARSAPRQSTTGASSSTSRRACAPCALRASRLALRSASSARAGGRANSDPMLARTACGENGSAQPGPRITGPSARACAERMIVPMLPGSLTACSHTLSAPPGSAQRRSYTPMARVPEPSVLAAASRSPSTSSPARKTNWAGHPALSADATRSSPSAANRPSFSRQRLLRSLRIVLSFWLSGDRIITEREQKGRLSGRPWSLLPWFAVKRPRPPGPYRQNVGTSRGLARRCRPAPCGRPRCRPPSDRA